MKLRQGTRPSDDRAEEELDRAIRRLAADSVETLRPGPPDAYWQNLIPRTNDRLDKATSGKALTISWAARVAIPGVIAIISFLVGLHYYAPQPEHRTTSLTTVILSLPDPAVDTLLADPAQVMPALSVGDLDFDPFKVSNNQIRDYLITAGNVSAAVEGLSEGEVSELLTAIGRGKSKI